MKKNMKIYQENKEKIEDYLCIITDLYKRQLLVQLQWSMDWHTNCPGDKTAKS